MARRRYARKPLLYIQQSGIKNPHAYMQDHYTSPAKSKQSAVKEKTNMPDTSSNVLETHGQGPKRVAKASVDQEEEQVVADTIPEKEIEEKNNLNTEKERIKFSDMTLKQKIAYFINKPSNFPRMRCVVNTDEKAYRGTIVGFEDNCVHIRSSKRSSAISVPLDRIKDIRLLGF